MDICYTEDRRMGRKREGGGAVPKKGSLIPFLVISIQELKASVVTALIRTLETS